MTHSAPTARPGRRRPKAPLTDAQRDLAARHLPFLFFLLARLGRRPPYDLLPAAERHSAGLLALCKAARGYRPDGPANFATYAAVVVERELLATARRWRRWPQSVEGLGRPGRDNRPFDPADTSPPPPEPDETPDPLLPYLGQALGRLDRFERQVIDLRYRNGWSPRVVSNFLGGRTYPVGSVAALEASALAKLRRALAVLSAVSPPAG